MEYRIYEGNIERLDKKMQSYKRKFDKVGTTLTYEKIGEEFESFGTERNPDIRKFIVVKVEGFARLNGWEIIGKVEATPYADNITTCYNTNAFDIVDRFRRAEIVCEHCKTKAVRKYGYILQNEESGAVKMVGTACLSQFVGINVNSYVSLLAMFDDIAEFEEVPQGSGEKKYYSTDLVLGIAYQLIDKYGYTAKTTYNETEYYGKYHDDATSLAVCEIMQGRKPHKKYKDLNFKENEPETLKKVEEMKAFFKTIEPQNQYESNLILALKNEYVDLSKVGLLAAGVQTKRIKEQEAKRIEELTSEYVGTVGERIELKNCTFEKIGSYATQFGYVYIYKIICEKNTLVWKTSKCIENGIYNIKGTVKDHGEFRHEKQTELTRVKII